MPNDHLDKETSASLDITPTGVSAKIKSRTFAALDRLGGNLLDRWNAPMEAKTTEVRARSAANIRMIDALTEIEIERARSDPEFAARAIENHLRSLARRQENKDSVGTIAIQDLRDRPPNEEEANTGSNTLDDDFLSRFERYAEDATSDELRTKWGRVLAAEIRKPGTFSKKVMRTVDELDSDTAILFERLCRHRLGNVIVTCLAGDISFAETTALVTAGLIVDPGFTGHERGSIAQTDSDGHEWWMIFLGVGSVALHKNFKHPSNNRDKVLNAGPPPGVPVYVLTDVGKAIASILEDNQENAFSEYFDRLVDFLQPEEISEWRNQGDHSVFVRRIKKTNS